MRKLLDGKCLEYKCMLCYPSSAPRKRRQDCELRQTIEIAPSILSADFARLAQEIEKVEGAGADLIHLDVMDGHFVPNMTIGLPVVASIRKITRLPLDAHLMIDNPGQYLDGFIEVGINWLSVHVEADVHLDRTLRHLRQHGVRAGVALNPATPLSSLEEILPLADFVLIMTVNPGFGGQKFIQGSLDKIKRAEGTIAKLQQKPLLEVDGGVTLQNIASIAQAGADVLVAGAAVFGTDNYTETIASLKEAAQKF